MTKVGILETGRTSDVMTETLGDFPAMFRQYFSKDSSLAFTTHPISSGSVLPSIDAQDAWLITGSPAGVYEDHAWITPLEEFVRRSINNNIPVLGICFGHQLMAQALGGKVIKANKERGWGIHHYTPTTQGRALISSVESLDIVAAHQDQIVILPDTATILVESEFCPYAMLSYGSYGLSIQPHPEFTNDIGCAIAEEWQDEDPVDTALYTRALDNLAQTPSNADALLPSFSAFLSQNTSPRSPT